MTYLPGFSVKPSSISNTGEVMFTDGTREIMGNQRQCEAYGYKYNAVTGTCYAFNYSHKLAIDANNLSNTVKGSQNITGLGTTNSQITGERNTIMGESRNNIIVGDNNEIAEGVNNAAVFGNFGIAERSGELVIGGGGFNGAGKGYAQSSIITLTGTTTDATATSLYVNGDPNQTAITRGTGSVYTGFTGNLIGVRTGGTAAGSEGDRIFWSGSGIIYETTANESTPVVTEVGSVSGWGGAIAFSSSDLLFQVTGATDMNISWSCTLNLFEMKI